MDTFLVPDLRGNAFSFSPLRIMFAVGLSYVAFTTYEVGSFFAHFLKSFHHKWCWILSKAWQAFWKPSVKMQKICIYWDYHIVFVFLFVNMVYHIDWFPYIEESLHPWNKPNLIMVYEIFECVAELFAKISLRIFASMFISDIGL